MRCPTLMRQVLSPSRYYIHMYIPACKIIHILCAWWTTLKHTVPINWISFEFIKLQFYCLLKAFLCSDYLKQSFNTLLFFYIFFNGMTIFNKLKTTLSSQEDKIKFKEKINLNLMNSQNYIFIRINLL